MSYYIPSQKSYHLFQPNSIAVLSSIAIHAVVLGIALPNANFVSDRAVKNNPQTVKITQLTPEELDRLPVLDPSENNAIEPLQSNPSSEVVKPKSITSIYPDLAKLDPQIKERSNSNSLTGLNNIKIPALPPPPPTRIVIPSSPPPVIPQQKQENVPRVRTFNNPAPQPNNLPNSQPKQQTKIANPQQLTQPEDTYTAPFSQEENTRIRQRFLQENIRQKAALITKHSENTTDEEAQKNYVTWTVKIQQEAPETRTIVGNYPQDICVRKIAAATVVYGISFDKDGKPFSLHLIKSSGYKIFDLQAEKDINSQTFQYQSDRPNFYRVDVNFEHNNKVCPGLGLSS